MVAVAADTMTALVNYGPEYGAVELRTVPVPEPGPGEVLLRVRAVGVCGSDLHQFHGTQSWRVNWPVTLGHEFSGEIAALGPGVDGWAVGERVACETAAWVCGTCALCRTGRYNLCPARLGFGYGVDGAAAKYVAARSALLHRIPAQVSWEEAALTEPCCVAANAVLAQSAPRPGDTRVVVLGVEDPAAVIGDLGDGLGADLVVDAAGVSAALRTALELVRPAGQITKVGWGREPLDFNLDLLVAKAVTLRGSFSHTWATWERTLQLLADGTLDVKPLVNPYPLERWQEAFARMESGEIAKAV